jgi:hypothetical protein
MKQLYNILRYAIPALCLLNVIFVDGDARYGWVVAFAGWTSLLLEKRKNDN